MENAAAEAGPHPPAFRLIRLGLAKQASQITMYDVKSYIEQAKNMVLNLSEMEAKVAEATNNDPWYVLLLSAVGQSVDSRGASSTLMQEIADG